MNTKTTQTLNLRHWNLQISTDLENNQRIKDMNIQQRPSTRTETIRTMLSQERNNMSIPSGDNQQPNPWNKDEVQTMNNTN